MVASKTKLVWLSYHLYYHEDRARPAVAGWLWPSVKSLLSTGIVQRFFYLHYHLGGSHLRLRLLIEPESQAIVERELQQRAVRFLEEKPSRRSLDAEFIRRMNERILAGAPLEDDSSAYPDNYFRPAPYVPEIERYGNEELLASSFEVFTLSSAQAVKTVVESADLSSSKRLPLILRLLVRQAWGFADDLDQLLWLLRCRVGSDGSGEIISAADRVFARRPEALIQLVAKELGLLTSGAGHAVASDLAFAMSSHRLSRELRVLDDAEIRRIKSAHLHMTANRMGFSNHEETYAFRLLGQIGSALAAQRPTFWQDISHCLASRAEKPVSGWEELIASGLAFLRQGELLESELITTDSSARQ